MMLKQSLIFCISFLVCLTVVWGKFDVFSAQVSQEDSIVAVAWSPDGQYIATADNNGVVQILDDTGEWIMILLESGPNPDGEEVNSVVWSPDGSKLAATDHTKIQIWNTENWEIDLTIDDSRVTWWSLAWSPDSTQLASVSYFDTGRNFRILDASDGLLVRQMDGHGSYYSVEWSPNGEMLAVPNGDGVSIWYPTDANAQYSFGRPGGELISSDWSPDSNLLAVLGDDSQIFIWIASTGDLEQTLDGQGRRYFMRSIRWSPDGTRIASVSDDGSLWVWNAETGEGIQIAQAEGDLYAVDWNPDSSQIVYGGQNQVLMIVDAPDVSAISDSTP